MVAMMSRAGESHSGIGFESQVSRERERKSKGVRKRKRGGDMERVRKREREVLREVERERERERKRMGKRMGKRTEPPVRNSESAEPLTCSGGGVKTRMTCTRMGKKCIWSLT